MERLDRALVWLRRWARRHWRWLSFTVLVGWGGNSISGSPKSWALLIATLGVVVVSRTWAVLAPVSYERVVAGPQRRFRWRRFVRRNWPGIAESCGLSVRVQPARSRGAASRATEDGLDAPRLCRVRARGHVLELTIRTRAGQTIEDLDDAAPRLASTLAAVAHRTRPVSGAGSGCTAVVELVMRDALVRPAAAHEPDPVAVYESVRLGRAQGGGDWALQLRGRHTLVAGCSGAGKGSVLWGICCGLAPAARADVVRLWGVDLKRGVELAMGEPLFHSRAYTPAAALDTLRALMAVIDERGHAMAGATRLHEPVVGDPLHVLVIDELAALTAYAESSIRREAERLLSEILTQGRALGVVVVACVQDPRKDVVAMRGLFTQTVALRLRSTDETAMVLGDGMTHVAPAHRISPTHPGTGWVVDDAGAADRVRADFWPDDLIRDVARRYASTTRHHSPRPPTVEEDSHGDSAGDAASLSSVDANGERRPRASRQRTPRSPRSSSRSASTERRRPAAGPSGGAA